MARTGIVAEAAIDVLAAALSTEFPLGQEELRRLAERQASELARAGFKVTVPVAAIATTQRRTRGA